MKFVRQPPMASFFPLLVFFVSFDRAHTCHMASFGRDIFLIFLYFAALVRFFHREHQEQTSYFYFTKKKRKSRARDTITTTHK